MRVGILGGGQLAMMMVQQSDTNFDFLILIQQNPRQPRNMLNVSKLNMMILNH